MQVLDPCTLDVLACPFVAKMLFHSKNILNNVVVVVAAVLVVAKVSEIGTRMRPLI